MCYWWMSIFGIPNIHKAFGIPRKPGLSDMLEHKYDAHLFCASGKSEFESASAGIALSHPADLLSLKTDAPIYRFFKSSPYLNMLFLMRRRRLNCRTHPILASQVTALCGLC